MHRPSTQNSQVAQTSSIWHARPSLLQSAVRASQRSPAPQSRSLAQPGLQTRRSNSCTQTMRRGQSSLPAQPGLHSPQSSGKEQVLPFGQAHTLPLGQSPWDWQRSTGRHAPATQVVPGRQSRSAAQLGAQAKVSGSQASEWAQPECRATQSPATQIWSAPSTQSAWRVQATRVSGVQGSRSAQPMAGRQRRCSQRSPGMGQSSSVMQLPRQCPVSLPVSSTHRSAGAHCPRWQRERGPQSASTPQGAPQNPSGWQTLVAPSQCSFRSQGSQ